ncbi:MAG: translation initiation factor IF-2 [Halanaerobiaceae bacterium]
MGKKRIYQLAKELDMESKELIDILQDLGIDVSSHMSTIEDETADLVRGMVAGEEESEQEEQQKETQKQQEVKEEKKEQTQTEQKVEVVKEEVKATKEEVDYIIELPITVKELAEKIDYAGNSLIKKLMGLGVMANINYNLDQDLLELLGEELDLNFKIVEEKEEKDQGKLRVGPEVEDDPEDLELRPPIVTVMGHVDHGKTTLLDVIRETRVVEGEAGGITQHIGAYQAVVNGQKISFIDTPGHEAFTAMRARGAQITDIVILVIAADDGVMPQTVEAINHAQAADIPILVAINKIDKPNAQVERVKQQLTEYEMLPEEWGGDTIVVELSALKQQNIDELMEMILLVSEMEEIKANPSRPAEGFIIESELDKGRGPVATMLVKNGTLHVGDFLISGSAYGRVKAMLDEQGQRIEEALPSTPVEVLGFNNVPEAGNFVQVLEDESKARKVAEERREEQHEQELQQQPNVSLEDLYDQIQAGEIKELNVIIKADVHGSIEALRSSLEKLSTDEVAVNVIHTGVGAINETDVNLASASRAIIIGFNVRPDNNAQEIAEKENVEIQSYRVIYKVIEDVKDAMAGLLDPELKEIIKGRAEVRAVFKVPDIGNIAGSFVRSGVVNRNDKVRLLRDGVVIHEGEISSLKRFEDDVREVKEGYECGIGVEGYNDIKEGDILEIYNYKEIKRSL